MVFREPQPRSTVKNPADPLAAVRLRPCSRTWESLEPGPAGVTWRSCDECRLRVHDASALREEELRRLLCERAGRLSLRIERCPDGSIVTADGARAGAAVTWLRRVATAASWLLLCLGLAPACTPPHEDGPERTAASRDPESEPSRGEATTSTLGGAELTPELKERLATLGYVCE